MCLSFLQRDSQQLRRLPAALGGLLDAVQEVIRLNFHSGPVRPVNPKAAGNGTRVVDAEQPLLVCLVPQPLTHHCGRKQ